MNKLIKHFTCTNVNCLQPLLMFRLIVKISIVCMSVMWFFPVVSMLMQPVDKKRKIIDTASLSQETKKIEFKSEGGSFNVTVQDASGKTSYFKELSLRQSNPFVETKELIIIDVPHNTPLKISAVEINTQQKDPFELFIPTEAISYLQKITIDWEEGIKPIFDQLARLLAASKDNPSIKDKEGNTLLMLAVKNKSHETLKKIIDQQWTQNIDERDSLGNTALILAIRNNDIYAVEELLAAGANPFIADVEGNLPLNIARMNSNPLILDLLIKKLGPIPEKSCLVSFELNDNNGSITNHVLYSLFNNVITIISPHLLKNLFDENFAHKSNIDHQLIIKHFLSGQWSLFLNRTRTLGVIVPEKISDSLLIHKNFGLHRVEWIQPDLIIETIQRIPKLEPIEAEYSKILDEFETIIDPESAHHLTRFYLVGHGGPKIAIAGIPFNMIQKFFDTLARIEAEFLYIDTCSAGGINLMQMQKAISEILKRQPLLNLKKQTISHMQEYEQNRNARTVRDNIDKSEYSGKPLNAAIVVQATSDTGVSVPPGNMNLFFMKLNEFLKKPDWTLKRTISAESPQLTIADVISSLQERQLESLPSIRVPGHIEFFRSVDVGTMKIITAQYLAQEREKSLSLARKSFDQAAQLALEKVQDTQEEIKALQESLRENFHQHVVQKLDRLTKDRDYLKAQEIVRMATLKALKPNLQKSELVVLTIEPDIKYIQVFAQDLSDCTFVIKGSTAPQFISKIPGQAQHFIGKIIFNNDSPSTFEPLSKKLESFILNNFLGTSERRLVPPSASTKCWFIKFFDSLPRISAHIRNVVVKLDPPSKEKPGTGNEVSYSYIESNFIYNRYNINGLWHEGEEGKNKYIQTITEWFKSSIASYHELFEATRGYERIGYTVQDLKDLNEGKKTNEQLYKEKKIAKNLLDQFLEDVK